MPYSLEIQKRYEYQALGRVIAVDFDSTITEHRPYPQRAPLNKTAKKYLDKLNARGFRIVLWTSRLQEDLDEAYNRCIKEFGLFYIIKDNPNLIHGATGKLVASFYIDDNSYVNKKIPWRKIYKYLIKRYK